MSKGEQWWRRCLILPASLYRFTWVAAVLALVLAATSPRLGSEPAVTLEGGANVKEICGHEFPSLAKDNGSDCCGKQLHARNQLREGLLSEQRVACKRYTRLTRKLREGEPLARKALEEEEAEITRIYAGLRDLYGPPRHEESTKLYVNVAVTFALGILVLYLFGYHAKRVGIPSARSVKALRAPLLWMGGSTTLVAVVVTLIESLDEQKTSFDWASFCLSQPAFYVHHAIQLPLAFLTAVQLSAGWYAMGVDRRGTLDPTKPRWGVGPYVNFLETWCVLIVVLTAVTTALWAHQLVASPTRTNLLTGMLGFGALGSIVALIIRINRTALELRERCEELKMTEEKAPDDPTGDLVGKSWWQMPSVFAVSSGFAWWILESTGVSELLKF